jgi:cation:H+ antiporter
LVVSLISSIKGKSMIAVGNVVGSNICNIALVLGLSALLNPIKSDPSVIRRDIPIMLGISLYLLVLSINNTLGRIEGATLFAGIIAYTFFNYYLAKKENQKAGSSEMTAAIVSELEEIGYIASRSKQILLVLIGIVGVVGGAQMVVESAVFIMTELGVSEKFIGLTIVAFGTSLPELATSVVAAMRGEMDISIGNLVGSNVFNIMSVLGAASLVRPIPIPGGFFASGLWIDYLVMLFTSFLPWLLMRKTYTVDRKGGAMLLTCYVGYLVYLIAKA